MAEDMNRMNRRDALKTTAKVAGAAALAAPVVVGSFSSPAAHATSCQITDSDAIPATILKGFKQNQNCGDGCCGRYNAQKGTFEVVDGVVGEVNIGEEGVTDNFLVEDSWYTISAPGYDCTATWGLTSCPQKPGRGFVDWSSPTGTGNGGLPKLGLPYCRPNTGFDCSSASPNNFLVLVSVVCCPDGTTPT